MESKEDETINNYSLLTIFEETTTPTRFLNVIIPKVLQMFTDFSNSIKVLNIWLNIYKSAWGYSVAHWLAKLNINSINLAQRQKL